MIKLVCTFFGVGLLRPAPGTWGSLAAVGLAVLAYEAGLASRRVVAEASSPLSSFLASLS